jgi:hypothetical protein
MFKSQRDDIFIENQATQHRAQRGEILNSVNKKDKISKKINNHVQVPEGRHIYRKSSHITQSPSGAKY